jgi:hypothetical protein
VALGLAGQAGRASALTIETVFLDSLAPPNTTGSGTLADLVRAAADIWERAILDDFVVTFEFGWSPLGLGGIHLPDHQDPSTPRETGGEILFDNSGASPWFLDPTPDRNEEYRVYTEYVQDLGGGPLVVGRVFSRPDPLSAAAGRWDLLSVALHEIGHGLGMSLGNPAFVAEARDGDVDITAPRPMAGSSLPLATNLLGVTSHFHPLDMAYGPLMAGINLDERRLPSEADILANAEISGFTQLDLTIAELPQPGTLAFLIGAVMLVLASRRRGRPRRHGRGRRPARWRCPAARV